MTPSSNLWISSSNRYNWNVQVSWASPCNETNSQFNYAIQNRALLDSFHRTRDAKPFTGCVCYTSPCSRIHALVIFTKKTKKQDICVYISPVHHCNQTPDLICSRNNSWKESGAEKVPGEEIRDPEIIWCREIGTPLAQHLSRKVHKILRVGLFQLDSRGISVRTSVLLPPFPHRPLCTCSCYCSTRLQFSKQTNSISHTSAPIMVYIQMFSDFRKYSTCTLDHCIQQFA